MDEDMNRIRRAPFVVMLFGSFIFLILGFLLLWFVVNRFVPEWITITLMVLWFIFCLIMYFAAMVARLHDIDASGWWCLLIFVPTVNVILMLVLIFMHGSPGENRYGPAPSSNLLD